MTTTALPFPDLASCIDTEAEDSFKEISASFGDSYEQVAPLGVNPVIELYTIVWIPLSVEQRNTLRSVLRSVGTWGILTWTPINETVERRFRLRKGSTVKYSPVASGLYRVTITVNQVFDI